MHRSPEGGSLHARDAPGRGWSVPSTMWDDIIRGGGLECQRWQTYGRSAARYVNSAYPPLPVRSTPMTPRIAPAVGFGHWSIICTVSGRQSCLLTCNMLLCQYYLTRNSDGRSLASTQNALALPSHDLLKMPRLYLHPGCDYRLFCGSYQSWGDRGSIATRHSADPRNFHHMALQKWDEEGIATTQLGLHTIIAKGAQIWGLKSSSERLCPLLYTGLTLFSEFNFCGWPVFCSCAHLTRTSLDLPSPVASHSSFTGSNLGLKGPKGTRSGVD
ncbi:hypothetical protein BO71DRAFT_121989 [Aspergillus ellipticus CBS 707.79]|uniref:Uncharacterized protein n=1 Tax=Aspergillus ellipticus CBS 707.79 TaxID=1448320 RepID=A0A319E1J2_9EURO|nr:hypothetical protein BO71DRAFT_121989 [Aspergillus ellipticus CBS 707.79]